MRIGCPREIKPQEFRVGMTPDVVREATRQGHDVFIESGAGDGAGFSNEEYIAAGASVVPDGAAVFEEATMIVKVKEPQAEELERLNSRHLLFTYLHLAPDPKQAEGLIRSGCTAIAYETITAPDGSLPVLSPMSEVAGRLAPQVGASALQKANGGRGVLLGGVPGVPRSHVTVIGGGVVGTHAARIALGFGAEVAILDLSLPRLRQIDETFQGKIQTVFASRSSIEAQIATADLVIGAVLIPGATAPKLVQRNDLANMKRGAVLVDVAIDQGGCFETSRATTHAEPTYFVDEVLHYCVANMPGAVPRTATLALSNVTSTLILDLANKGWQTACRENSHLRNGLNVHSGCITHPAVAEALNRECADAKNIVGVD